MQFPRWLAQAGQDIKEGGRVGDLVQAQLDLSGTARDNRHTVLPISGGRDFWKTLGEGMVVEDPKTKKQIQTEPITIRKPLKFVGALGARGMTDMGYDSTRHIWWRHNHPMAILDRVQGAVIGDQLSAYTPAQRSAITLASIGAPAAASLGVWDATNPGELFRPKGYAQSYAETGSDDRRKTAQPGVEFVERMVLGRRGRPLNYETAKKDLPNLTRLEYSNFIKDHWQNKGLTGMGLVKGSMRNLEGNPEVRIIGFPVGLQAVGAATGGLLAAKQALKSGENTGVNRATGAAVPRRARTVALRGGLGALGGIAAGKLSNMVLASATKPKYPTTLEYQADKINRGDFK